MHEAAIFALVLAAGYIASGVISSFYMLVTGKTEFAPKPSSDIARLATMGLTIFIGPSLLTNNVLKADNSDQPRAYVWIMLGLTLLWSYLLGLFFVTLAIAIPTPF